MPATTDAIVYQLPMPSQHYTSIDILIGALLLVAIASCTITYLIRIDNDTLVDLLRQKQMELDSHTQTQTETQTETETLEQEQEDLQDECELPKKRRRIIRPSVVEQARTISMTTSATKKQLGLSMMEKKILALLADGVQLKTKEMLKVLTTRLITKKRLNSVLYKLLSKKRLTQITDNTMAPIWALVVE